MFDVTIKVDSQRLQRGMSDLEKKQYPYALASALNKTAFDARKAVVSRTKRQFKLYKKKFILGNIKVDKAKKMDVKNKGYAFSVVYSGEKISGFMNQHEKGGPKLPKCKKYLAVPGDDLPKRARTSKGIRHDYKPSVMLKDYKDKPIPKGSKPKVIESDKIKGKKRKRKKGSGSRKAFIMRLRNSGTPVIAKRTKKTPTPVKIYWVLVKQAKLKARWGFKKTVMQRANRVFPKNFRKAMQYAIKTAK